MRVLIPLAVLVLLTACGHEYEEAFRSTPRTEQSTTATTPAPAVDAGADAASAPVVVVDAFAGAEAFRVIKPSTESSAHHGGASNAGTDCMRCHATDGAPRFALGGTVYNQKSGRDGAQNTQVRVLDATGAELAMIGTDSAGNFWLPGPLDSDALPAGATLGIRNATRKRTMQGAAGSGCNGCHVGRTGPDGRTQLYLE